ncbi:flavoprotein [Thermosporothrix hazakensis]|jgi:phosphopantothenoylcysteine synthetase/decarboxylase|uniref:Flavoprotein n=2 Tax=Thermosporothrix TaxID=768650 RepID=A0A326U923_THEHA|nr:flavoprotein [Thermosporothrix hazakensis]PZW31146.1 flavoprotein [Thermosporothrix hazakensis]BBH86633.1 hypothetical protein KTC_13840 [Thermosporothrix sp. COM3]GCE50942.1 hypothetical protein KTH_58110 [Thermosporothrix hazakensis]
MNSQTMKRVLYLVICAAGAAPQAYELIPLLIAAGWNVCAILTPSATAFVEQKRLHYLTGNPVRTNYKQPGTPDLLPPPDALLVFPATFNTVNKWALGISDNLALGLLCEHTGIGTPILAVPVVRRGKLAEHPAFPQSLKLLTEYGIHVLYEPEQYPPRNEVPGEIIVQELLRITSL